MNPMINTSVIRHFKR